MRGAPVVIDRCLECHVRVRRRRLGQQVDGVGVGHDPVRVHPPQSAKKDGTRRVGLADGLLVRAAKCRRGPTESGKPYSVEPRALRHSSG